MLNRRSCLAVYIAFIDPFVQTMVTGSGKSLLSNILAFAFVILRLAESFKRVPFLKETTNKLYMVLLGAYATIVAQILYL